MCIENQKVKVTLKMQCYIGSKMIMAKPMDRREYCAYRGWDVPEDENPNDRGYLIEYLNSPNSNHPYHDNYISWSPLPQFEESYRNTSGMNFGFALDALKLGLKVARKGWNGKAMWLLHVPGSDGIRPVAGTPYSNAGLTAEIDINPHIDMFTADGSMQPGWLASQTDMLAEDWVLIE